MTFEDVVRECGPAVWRVVASYSAPGADRDDLTQDVLLAIWQALPRFRGPGPVRAFVLRIAHNRSLSWVWQAKRRRPASEAPELTDSRPDPEGQLSATEESERFMAHVRTLKLGQREVLTLALEGLSTAEIADIAGISVGAVAVRLSRARAQLRRLFSTEGTP